MATAISPELPPAAAERSYYNPAEAGRKLRVGQRFLRDGVNHHGFPHSRLGNRLVFSDADLAEIYRMFRAPAQPRRRARRAA